MLNEAYGITERDFTRAEIEVVPAYKARDIGLDRAMIGAYGHDDRVDAYPALMAEIGTKSPVYTSVCVLTDKEETGSDGVTGLNSMYTFHFLQQLCAGQGADYITACKAAKCLSADVTAAYDPTFADAFEPDNGTYAGRGVAIYKYTGSRGKSGTSDASAELVSYLTGLMDAKQCCVADRRDGQARPGRRRHGCQVCRQSGHRHHRHRRTRALDALSV